jgi:hypothetical protein
MEKPGGRVFISHAPKDSDWAHQLVEQLTAAGLKVWDSSTDLLPGVDFTREVSRALDRADFLVVLISPAAVKSEWVRREIQYALGVERFQDKLIPVLIEPTAKEDVPWILNKLTWAKGTPQKVAEHIAKAVEKSRVA